MIPFTPRLFMLSPLLLVLFLDCVVLFALPSFAVSDGKSTKGEKNHEDDAVAVNKNECGVYFAPSTIPGAGNGIFAGRSYEIGEEVTLGDLIVAITDFSFHNKGDDGNDFLWDSYTWEAESFESMQTEAREPYGASFGIGAAVNCFDSLINVDTDYGVVDSEGLHRSKDPGVGGFTIYHGRKGVAAEDIPEGMELFVDYGDGYFDGKREEMGIPTSKDYELARLILQNFDGKLTKELVRSARNASMAENVAKDLYIIVQQDLKHLWTPPSGVLNALPDKIEYIDETLREGISYAHYNRSIRSADWFNEFATCADNLQEGPSTIKQAGRGAFLRRPIKAGENIAPMPLIHLHNRSVLDMYRPLEGRQGYPVYKDMSPDKSQPPFHRQLLLNYCFGHRNTDILLCPYGIGTGLVNHASSPELVNAKIVWSSKHMVRPEWLNMSTDQWVNETTAGLAFDLMSTRDLESGEEVFIDYGDEWEIAWRHHLGEWSPPPNAEQYITKQDLTTAVHFEDIAVPLAGESLRDHPFFTNIEQIRCHSIFVHWFGFEEEEEEEES
mmetsp:Transcript_10312/g.13647  ORF Transcript_10312/g.13647 Transcript_10312/m.13647 type:complete len:554 (+) Transcript_10312:67-1728(+)